MSEESVHDLPDAAHVEADHTSDAGATAEELAEQMNIRFAGVGDTLDAQQAAITEMSGKTNQIELMMKAMMSKMNQLTDARSTSAHIQSDYGDDEVSFAPQLPKPSISTAYKQNWVKFGLSFTAKSIDDDFESFIMQFETCCLLNEVPRASMVLILQVYLKDLAATYMRRVSS